MEKKKPVVTAIMMYVLVTTGISMFLNFYSNSYNRLSAEKIPPAGLVTDGERADIQILGYRFSFSVKPAEDSNKMWLVAYLLMPDELKILTSDFDRK